MRKFKRRQPHSLPFCLFLAVVGALLLPAAVAPRANAGSTDYWDFEDPLGSRPRPAPELFSQPQGVLINQPLASNYNPNLALNVASGGQPGGFQPLQVDANFSWSGVRNSDWNHSANWSPGEPARPRRYRRVQPSIPQSAQSHHRCYCRHCVDDERCRSKRHALFQRRDPQPQWPRYSRYRRSGR